MAGHQGFVLATAFDAGRDRLCSVSIEGWASVWDLETWQRMTAWPCHDGPVLDMTVTPSGTVLTAGHDGTAGVWTRGGSLIHRLGGHDGGVHAVAGRGRLIATGSADGRIRLWDGETGQLLRHLCGHSETVTSVAFLDPDHLISGARDRTVRLWPLEDGGSPQVFEGHDWWVTKVRPAANGRVVSASEDCSLRVWNPATGGCEWTFDGCPTPLWGLAVDPAGHRALIGYGGTTLLVELDGRAVREVAQVSGRAMSFSGDGNRAAIGQDTGDIDLIDLAAGPALLGRLPGAGKRILSGVAGADLTVGSRAGGEVVSSTRIWTPGTVEPLADLDHGGLVFSLAARAVGRLLAGGWDKVSLWNVDTGDVVWRVAEAGIGSHLVAAFGGGEPLVAGVGEAPVMKLWRVGDGEVGCWSLPDAHNCVIEPVPGGNLMVVGSAWGRVYLVNLTDGGTRLLHGEHEDWIRIARVSADGRRVLTISQNGTGRVYDLGLEQGTERVDRPVVGGECDGVSTLRWLDCVGVVLCT
ncbi:MAG: WD40 repeat domain-containing protein [Gammaproteobacteria bacterium]